MTPRDKRLWGCEHCCTPCSRRFRLCHALHADLGVRIPYKLGTAEFNIALSAPYQLLLLNPQRGCAILSGLREWERFRRLTNTSAANTPYCASPRELGWDGCADKEILLSSCGLNSPTSGSPRSASPAKPLPPCRETGTPCRAPPPPPPNLRNPKRPPHRSASPTNRAAALRRTRHSPVDMGRARGSRCSSKTGARSPPLRRGMSHLSPSYGYSHQMGYQTSNFRLLWTITLDPPPPLPLPPDVGLSPPPPLRADFCSLTRFHALPLYHTLLWKTGNWGNL